MTATLNTAADDDATPRRRAGRRAVLALLAVLGVTLAGPPVAAALPAADAAIAPCAVADGRVPIIEAGRERDVRALFAPHRAGEALGAPHGAWRITDVAIRDDAIEAGLEGPGGASALLRLRSRRCESSAVTTASFAAWLVGDGSAGPAAESLLDAVRLNDRRAFYRVFAEAPPANAAARSVQPPFDPQQLFGAPFNRSLAGLAFILLLALIAPLLDVRGLVRDLQLRTPGAGKALLGLAGMTLVGAALRWAADPTFIREAYPLPDVRFLIEPIHWAYGVAVYPEAQNLMTVALAPLLSAEPFLAWFQANVVFGTLTIPAAFVMGAGVTGQRRAGLVAAALCAFWPQHIRLSASEATHVGFVLWATLSVGLTALAARTGRLRTFAAAIATGSAAVVVRPEGALIAPALVVLALAGGPGVRDALRRPARLLPRLAAVGGALWLLGPMLLAIAGDETTALFDPTAKSSESLGLHSLAPLAQTLLLPTELNAYFDPKTAPLWLYPLAWWGLWRGVRSGPRAGAIAGALITLCFLLLYTGLPPSVTIWAQSRYHLSAFPGVLLLATLGLDDLLGRSPRLVADTRRVVAAAAIAAVGCGLWWPAQGALHLDWQRELHWLIDLGERRVLPEDGTRLIAPDNRRRFRDLHPRAVMMALSRGGEVPEASVPVALALERLGAGGEHGAEVPAMYLEGLYCYLAVGPGESFNPQCEAMHRTFELTEIESIIVDSEPFLLIYSETRPPPPLKLTLYRVGARRMSPAKALQLLPDPLPPGSDPPEGFDAMASATEAFMEPPVPPL